MEKTILNGSVKDWIINTYTKCLKTDLLEEISPCHTIFHFLWYHQSFLSSTIFGWFYENHDHCYIFFSTLSGSRSLWLDYTRWFILLGNFHLTVWLFLSTFSNWTYFMKSRYYFASPAYIVLRPLAEKNSLCFCILYRYTDTNFI